jgi:hypothetical protein
MDYPERHLGDAERSQEIPRCAQKICKPPIFNEDELHPTVGRDGTERHGVAAWSHEHNRGRISAEPALLRARHAKREWDR